MRSWGAVVAALLVVGCGRTSSAPRSESASGATGFGGGGSESGGSTSIGTSGGAGGPSAPAPSCAVAVTASDAHFCAVYQDGSVWCWGQGDGTSTSAYYEPSPIPVQVVGLSNIRSVTLGDAHGCALDEEGGIWCWGDNADGQINPSLSAELGPTPVTVPGSSAVRLGLGKAQTCAQDAGGDVRCWGRDASGARSLEPLLVYKAAPGTFALGHVPEFLDEHGRVVDISTWADLRTRGELGANNAQHVLGQPFGNPRCLVKRSGSLWCNGYGFEDDQERFYVYSVLGESVLQAGAGDLFLCALTQAGRVWCEGLNVTGQTGQESSSGFRPGGLVPGLDGVASLAVGRAAACALQADGAIFCWGAYAKGKASSTPMQVSGCADQRRAPTVLELPAPSHPAWRLAEAGRARGQTLCGCAAGAPDATQLEACTETEDFSPHAACLIALLPEQPGRWECLSNLAWEEAVCFGECSAQAKDGTCSQRSCEDLPESGALRYCRREHRCEPDSAVLPRKKICNAIEDCADGSDERNCVAAQGSFSCTDLSSVDLDRVCDLNPDCADGSDESRCY